jgi:hypothetical protein
MVPHSFFTCDRQLDLTLHVLTLVVSSALVAALAYLLVSSLAPPVPADRGDVGPPSWAAMPEVFAIAPRYTVATSPLGPLVYRCETDGRVSYADRPCPRGRVRVVPLPTS